VVVFQFDCVSVCLLSVSLSVCLSVTNVSCAGISRSVQVTISGDSHSLLVTKLVENVKYVFSVRARTKIDWGETVNGSTTTGPQKGLYHRAPKSVVTKGHRKVYTIGQPKYFVPMGTAEFVPYGHHMTSGRFVPESYRQIHALSNVAFFH